jgi:hypothetical protein
MLVLRMIDDGFCVREQSKPLWRMMMMMMMMMDE